MEKYVKNISEVKAVKPGLDVVILDGGALKCAKIVDTMVYNTANGWFVEYTMNDGTKYDNTVKFMVSEEDVNGANKLSRVEVVDIFGARECGIGYYVSYITLAEGIERDGTLELYDETGESVLFKSYNLELRKNGQYYMIRTDTPGKALYREKGTANEASKTFNGKTAKELLTLTVEQRQAWENLKKALEECQDKNIKFLYYPEAGELTPYNWHNMRHFNDYKNEYSVSADVISTLETYEIEFSCWYELKVYCELDINN